VSIKKKLVTAVTTAGLLAGLFGAAFVPVARAAAAAVASFTAAAVVASSPALESNEDYADNANDVVYYSTAVFPKVVIEFDISADDNDDGVYEVEVEGGTIKACALDVTDDGNDAGNTADAAFAAAVPAAAGLVVTTTSCTWTAAATDIDDDMYIMLTLAKLTDGQEVTITVNDPDTDGIDVDNLDTVEGRATTKLSDDISASESLDSIGLDAEGDGDIDGANDADGDVTIGGKEFFAPEQDQGSEVVVAGFLLNSYGQPYTTDTVIIAEVTGTGDETVGCDQAVDGASADSGDALVAFTLSDNDAEYECQVHTDAETAGGAFSLEVQTASGLLIMEYDGGFLGEVATVTITAVDDYIGADIDADIDDFIRVVVKDAGGRAYADADITNLDGEDVTAVDADDANLDDADDEVDGTTDGYYKLDKDICDTDDLDQGEKAYYSWTYEDGAGEAVDSNVLVFTCGPDGDDTADIQFSAFEFEAGTARPGETFEFTVTVTNEDGDLLGYGSEWSVDLALDLTGATDTGDDCGLDDDDIDDSTASGLIVKADGKIVCELKASTTVGTQILANDPESSLTAGIIVSTAIEGTLAKGTKKGSVIATFAQASRQVIKFEVENANTGVVRTYSRRASAAGVAQLDIARRGLYYVTAYLATDDTSLTDTLTIRRR